MMVMRVLLLILCVLFAECSKGNKPVSTIVTGLWDIKRGLLTGRAKRSFEYYLHYFQQLLNTETNLIIFGDKHLKQFVKAHRKRENYIFIERELDWFQGRWHNELVQRVRKRYYEIKPNWQQISSEHPEFGLYLYNTIIMTKPYLMQEALQYDIWNSDYLLWQDGGIGHSFFNRQTGEKVIFPVNFGEQQMYFLQWPSNFNTNIYYTRNEDRAEINDLWAWANFFNLYVEIIADFRSTYENMLRIHLEDYDMSTEEGIFTYMFYKFPFLIPMITGIMPQTIHHKFQVSSYHSYKIKTDRHFKFDQHFQSLLILIETGRQNAVTEKSADHEEERHICRKVSDEWLNTRNYKLLRSKLLKYFAFFIGLVCLYAKVKLTNNQIDCHQRYAI